MDLEEMSRLLEEKGAEVSALEKKLRDLSADMIEERRALEAKSDMWKENALSYQRENERLRHCVEALKHLCATF